MTPGENLLSSVITDMEPKYNLLFSDLSPFLREMVEKKRIAHASAGAVSKEFLLVHGAPGTANTIVHGGEEIQGGMKKISVRGTESLVRSIVAFDIPRGELALSGTKQDMGRIVEAYPDLALLKAHDNYVKQTLTGTADAGYGGFTTWNGQSTYAPQGIAKDGLFRDAALASQTGTVHGVVKQGGAGGITGWGNQYRQITNFSNHGLRRIREMQSLLSRLGRKMKPTAEIGFTDATSYHNYISQLDGAVRYTADHPRSKDKYNVEDSEGVLIGRTRMYIEDLMDISTMGGDFTNGAMFFISPETFELLLPNQHKDLAGTSFFGFNGPFRIPLQDLVRTELLLNFNSYCDNLRLNALITGSAV